MIEIINNQHINISEVPELVVISQHLEEYYPDKKIYVCPYKNDSGKIMAGYYIGCKSLVTTYNYNRASVRRIRHRRELVDKLTLLGMEIHWW